MSSEISTSRAPLVSSRRYTGRIAERAAYYAGYLLVAAVVLTPLLWVFLGSVKETADVYAIPPKILPSHTTFANYAEVFARADMAGFLANTLIVTLGTLVLTLGLGSLAAYGFSRWTFPFKNVVLVTMLVFQLIPNTINIVPYYLMMNRLGLVNTHLGLILIYSATNAPLVIWIMRGFFDTLPRSLDEAAIIDGCSRLQVLFRIILPVSLPGLSSAGFIVFIHAWSEFLIPLIIASKKEVAVVSMGLYSFFGVEGGVSYNLVFAAAVVAALPVVIAYLFAQEYLISGLTGGSEK